MRREGSLRWRWIPGEKKEKAAEQLPNAEKYAGLLENYYSQEGKASQTNFFVVDQFPVRARRFKWIADRTRARGVGYGNRNARLEDCERTLN